MVGHGPDEAGSSAKVGFRFLLPGEMKTAEDESPPQATLHCPSRRCRQNWSEEDQLLNERDHGRRGPVGIRSSLIGTVFFRRPRRTAAPAGPTRGEAASQSGGAETKKSDGTVRGRVMTGPLGRVQAYHIA